MKKIKLALIVTTLTAIMTGCGHEHTWADATCTEPKTCTECVKTEGEALGHEWREATCAAPKTCNLCGLTEGEALPHTWEEATCAAPKTCSVCGATEGEALEHTWIEANYQTANTCSVCCATEGEPLVADFELHNLECNAELDVEYPYHTICSEERSLATVGTIKVSDYATFDSDEVHEALDGYEWKTVTMTYRFSDENARKHGMVSRNGCEDYYNIAGKNDTLQTISEDSQIKSYTLNFNGVNYEECRECYETLESGWNNRVYTYKARYYERVPKGYDGVVIVAFDAGNLVEDDMPIYDVVDENSVIYRLPAE